jgi:hypothetical protein
VYPFLISSMSATSHAHLILLYEGVLKGSGLAAWSKNCKWYSSLPIGAVVSLFSESVEWVLPP